MGKPSTSSSAALAVGKRGTHDRRQSTQKRRPDGNGPSPSEIEQYLLENGLPAALSGHSHAWDKPEEFVSEDSLDPKPEPDIDDHFAITADFSKEQPSAAVLERRLQYRKHLWVNCMPLDQRFGLFAFYGPEDEGYDIESESGQPGFECFGLYPDMKTVYEKVAEIRQRNPHAVSFPIRCLDLGMGKRVDLPPPADGNTRTSHINKFHEQIMNRHFRKTVAEFHRAEDRTSKALDEINERNTCVERYADRLEEHAKALLHMQPSDLQNLRDKSKEKLCQLLPPLDPAEAAKSRPTDTSGKTICQQIEEEEAKSREEDMMVKSLTYDQVQEYLEHQSELVKMPPGYRAVYRRYPDPKTGKEYLVKALQSIVAT